MGLVGWAARGLVSETNTGVKSTDWTLTQYLWLVPVLKPHAMPRSVSSTSRSCYPMSMSSRPEQSPEGEAGSGPGIQNKLLQMLRMQTRHTEFTGYGIKHEWWSQRTVEVIDYLQTFIRCHDVECTYFSS
jgi:hypothetical protein